MATTADMSVEDTNSVEDEDVDASPPLRAEEGMMAAAGEGEW
jgi:hypothetical protein